MTTATKEEKKEEKQVVKYSVTDAVINKMEQDYLHLKLKSPDDTEGFKKIVEYKRIVKGKRLDVEAQRKKLKADSLEYGRRVDAEATRIKGRLLPIENHLIGQEDIIKNERERLKQIELEKKQAAHDEKIKQIINAGAIFNGSVYIFGEKTVSDERIAQLSDEEFETFIERINLWKEKENLRIAEEERVKKQEEERQAKIATENRQLQEKLAKQQAEQDKKDQKLKEEKEKIEQQKLAIKQQKEIDAAEKKAKIEAEKKAKQDKIRHEQEIDAVKQKAIEDEKRNKLEIEAAKKKAAEDAKKDVARKEKEKLEKEKKEKARLAREEKLRPDKEKISTFADTLESIEWPTVKAPEANEVLDEGQRLIAGIIGGLREGIENL